MAECDGIILSSDPVTIIRHNSYKKQALSYPVIALHGASSNDPYANVDNYWAGGGYLSVSPLSVLSHGLANAGRWVAAPLLSTAGSSPYDTWGNATALSEISNVYNWLQTQPVKLGKVILVGASMGGGAAYAWAQANISNVAGIIQLVPVSDLNDIVSNNRSGLASSVNTAFGGAYSNASFGAQSNPTVFASSLTSLASEILISYGLQDITVLPSTVISVATAIGVPNSKLLGVAGTHSTAGFNMDFGNMLNFAKTLG